MSALDTLPADQRAVLQLLLKQGRTYEQIASTLRIAPDAVADRAYAALEHLGPDAGGVGAEQREEIADYLLGQMSATGRRRVREALEEDAGSRAWARAVRSELRPLGGDDLPEVPADPEEVDEAFDALSARREAQERHEQSSRKGGVLLLAALALILVGAILWATGVLGGGGDDDDLADRPTTSTATSEVTPIAQVNLRPPEGRDSNALGVAFVVSGQGQQAIRVDAEGLPRGTRGNSPREGACIWLQADDRAEFVGCFREVSAEGAASASGVLPADIRQFPRLIVTRETGTDTPTRPGTTILSGAVQAPQVGTTSTPGGTSTAPATPPPTATTGG